VAVACGHRPLPAGARARGEVDEYLGAPGGLARAYQLSAVHSVPRLVRRLLRSAAGA
ncbi:unnamed protein product, partial [Effrenium voratum]